MLPSAHHLHSERTLCLSLIGSVCRSCQLHGDADQNRKAQKHRPIGMAPAVSRQHAECSGGLTCSPRRATYVPASEEPGTNPGGAESKKKSVGASVVTSCGDEILDLLTMTEKDLVVRIGMRFAGSALALSKFFIRRTRRADAQLPPKSLCRSPTGWEEDTPKASSIRFPTCLMIRRLR